MSAIQGQLLEVTVVGCSNLRDTEWISKQDPYVCLEYAHTKFRTRTCTDGHKNPTFQEKFVFNLIEGLRELHVLVWNSNTLTVDDFIGSGRAQLQKVLSQGFDDSSWPLQSKNGRHAGEVRLIMHFAGANKFAVAPTPSAPPYVAPSPYSMPPPMGSSYPPTSSYPPVPSPYPSSYPAAPPPSSYPGTPPPGYPPSTYPGHTYPPNPAAYPPSTYPSGPYQPPTYPPHPPAGPSYPPGPYPGIYPPPPY